jgi:hypothetical protein
MPWALYVEGAIKTVEVFANNSSADQFVNKFETALKDMLTMTETYWSAVENVIQGENGADGYEGSYAVQAYNLCISGDGNLEIHGGNGGNGYNGSGAILGSTKGGRGGDSGSAIFCKKYVNVMSSSNYIIKSTVCQSFFGRSCKIRF